MINSRNGKRLLIVILIVLTSILMASVVMAGGDCPGKSCKPLPDGVILPIQATRNPHYPASSPIGESQPMPTPIPQQEIPVNGKGICGYTMDTLCDGVTPPTIPTRVPTTEPIAYATRIQPTQECGMPVSDLGPDDVALLIEAVHEGYQIIIVSDVLATHPDVIVIGN